VFFLGWVEYDNLWAAMACGTLATGLSLVAFGLDPLRDKGHETPENQLQQRVHLLTLAAERTLDDLVLRIGRLDDLDLIKRTKGVQKAVRCLLGALARDPATIRSVRKPLMKLLHIAAHEADRLDEAWDTPDRAFARQRYIANLSAMAIAFEVHARLKGTALREDGLEFEADLLLDRMTQEFAA
ncbi:MAG: hypothetical protein ACKVKF_06400, partial [Rhodobacterales bacterium]